MRADDVITLPSKNEGSSSTLSRQRVQKNVINSQQWVRGGDIIISQNYLQEIAINSQLQALRGHQLSPVSKWEKRTSSTLTNESEETSTLTDYCKETHRLSPAVARKPRQLVNSSAKQIKHSNHFSFHT
jgi:hypothetical protein